MKYEQHHWFICVYEQHHWFICVDFKMINILLGEQTFFFCQVRE